MMRPTTRLNELQEAARPAALALDPSDLGAARATRHSFARTFLRRAAAERWTVHRERFDLDDNGQGTVVYRVDYGAGHSVRLVAFSTVVGESERTDRVIARTWDLTAALCSGSVDEDRLERMRGQVSAQEGGRADVGTLVWTRANRSARFFDHVVDRLANGLQPDATVIGDDAYLMRSTAFYANGKWGLVDFDGYNRTDALASPYRAQMLTAWLLRELSLDMVEHCAARRGSSAVSLAPNWRRYFGLGNATGLGMVPYVINHPQVLDAWVAMRELPLASVLTTAWAPDSPEAARVLRLLDRAVRHFAQRSMLATEPYGRGPDLARRLAPIVETARRFVESDDPALRAHPGGAGSLAQALHDQGEQAGVEVRSIVDSVLVEVDKSLDEEMELLLRCDEHQPTDLMVRCGHLRTLIDTAYRWVFDFNFDDAEESSRYWYYAADSQEPRRGRRDNGVGVSVEHSIDVARQVSQLAVAVQDEPSERSVVEFLFDHPHLRWAVERVLTCAELCYGEAHVNPLAERFLPLDLQRFQLAAYGMENYSPQSTDWLRVTLFSGAPLTHEVAVGIDDDWCFAAKPEEGIA